MYLFVVARFLNHLIELLFASDFISLNFLCYFRFLKVSHQYSGKNWQLFRILYACKFFELSKMKWFFFWIIFAQFWDLSVNRMISNIYVIHLRKKYGILLRASLKKRKQFDIWRNVSPFLPIELKLIVKHWAPNFPPMNAFEVCSTNLLLWCTLILLSMQAAANRLAIQLFKEIYYNKIKSQFLLAKIDWTYWIRLSSSGYPFVI